jgi:hypothetical protein
MPVSQSAYQRLITAVGRVPSTMVQDILVGIGLMANLIVVLSARHFPYADMANHLARCVVIERILWGQGSQDYSFHWIPTPYIGVDLIGVGLVHLFGPMVAEKVLASAAVALPIAGMYLLLRATAPCRRGWSLVAVLISYSWPLMAGLLNFVLGYGLVLCCLAWWWPRRDAAGSSMPTVVAVMTFGLFFVHASAPLLLLVVLAAATILKIPDLLADGWPAYRAAIRLPVLRTLLLGLIAFIAACWWMTASGQGSPNILGPLEFRTLTGKIRGFGGPFWVLSLKQAAFTAGSYGGLLVIFLWKHTRQPLRDPFFIAAGLSVLLYLVFPTNLNMDWRWLFLAYYLPFCLVAPNPRAESPKILALALLFCLINTAVIAKGVITIDRELDDYDAVLRQIPRGSRLLELANPPDRVNPYGQYGFWHLIWNDGHVSSSSIGDRIGSSKMGNREHPDYQPHLQHFIATWRPYNWDLVTPLDWQQIATDYDYIVLVTENKALREDVSRHARRELTVGAVSLYALDSCNLLSSQPQDDASDVAEPDIAKGPGVSCQ